ncbi:MAG: hypothetical protein V8Q76_01690 [Bacteroides intestinalis]
MGDVGAATDPDVNSEILQPGNFSVMDCKWWLEWWFNRLPGPVKLVK